MEESKNFINLGIVVEKDQALMIRRKKEEVGKDGSILRWAFPGGKQRFKETREECVEREILCETGYQVKSARQIDIYLHPQFPVMIVYHLCRLVSKNQVAEPKEPHEIAEIKWVKIRDIKDVVTTSLNPAVAKELKIDLA